MLIFQSQIHQYVLSITLIIWVISEFKTVAKRHTLPSKKDAMPIVLFTFLTLLFAGISIYTLEKKVGYMNSNFDWLFWLGIIVIYAGMAFRQYSAVVLGRFFVPSLQILERPEIIKKGPFRFIRHPAYAGFMYSMWGMGLTFLNWIFFLMIVAFSLIVFLNQIRIEERELIKYFGKDYEEYMKETKKMVPYIL